MGRNSEIGILLDRWELAKSGQGQAIFVSGEAGIGKSRLLEALIERMQDGPHEPIRLQCSPYHATSALYPVIQRLSRSVGLAADDDAGTRAEKLDRMLAKYGETPGEVRRGLSTSSYHSIWAATAPNRPIFPLCNARN